MPLAHTEGGLTASVQRGAKAVELSGGFRTYVVADRITRASCFVCRDAGDALALARWIGEQRRRDARVAARLADLPELSRYAVLREVKTHVVGPMCHVLWRWTTGDAVGPNMMTRNAYALNMAYVLPNAPVPIERAMLEANMGGDKKPSFEFFQSGHGKTVIAEATLTDEALARVLRTTAGGSRSALVGRHARRRRLGHAVGRVHAGVGDRRGLRRDRARTSAWSGRARWRTAPGGASRAASRLSIRFPGLEVGTVGGGTSAPDGARVARRCIGCDGPGKVYRFAQIVAAAALALEISASAAMATRRLRELLPRPLRARRHANLNSLRRGQARSRNAT